MPAIEAAFPGTTGPDGVDRAELGARVFGDDAAIKRLEAIVHPAVGEERAAFLAHHADDDMVVFDIPLLFETGGDRNVDLVVVVSAIAALCSFRDVFTFSKAFKRKYGFSPSKKRLE